MEKIVKQGMYYTHSIKAREDNPDVMCLTISFILTDGTSIAQVTIQSEKYVEALSKIEPFTGVKTLEDIAEKCKALGTVDLYYSQNDKFVGYSLTDTAFISTKTRVVNKMGTSKIIAVEHDDSTIVLHLEDGTIVRRNTTTKIGDKYFPDQTRRLRLLQNMGITGDLMTFDLDSMVGGTIEYYINKSAYGDWFGVENYKPASKVEAPVAPHTLTTEEQLAQMQSQLDAGK